MKDISFKLQKSEKKVARKYHGVSTLTHTSKDINEQYRYISYKKINITMFKGLWKKHFFIHMVSTAIQLKSMNIH